MFGTWGQYGRCAVVCWMYLQDGNGSVAIRERILLGGTHGDCVDPSSNLQGLALEPLDRFSVAVSVSGCLSPGACQSGQNKTESDVEAPPLSSKEAAYARLIRSYVAEHIRVFSSNSRRQRVDEIQSSIWDSADALHPRHVTASRQSYSGRLMTAWWVHDGVGWARRFPSFEERPRETVHTAKS
jgi:hypothetical protein